MSCAPLSAVPRPCSARSGAWRWRWWRPCSACRPQRVSGGALCGRTRGPRSADCSQILPANPRYPLVCAPPAEGLPRGWVMLQVRARHGGRRSRPPAPCAAPSIGTRPRRSVVWANAVTAWLLRERRPTSTSAPGGPHPPTPPARSPAGRRTCPPWWRRWPCGRSCAPAVACWTCALRREVGGRWGEPYLSACKPLLQGCSSRGCQVWAVAVRPAWTAPLPAPPAMQASRR